MRFGVNYVPSKNWHFSWVDFDEKSVREDICAIKELGFDHIRAHLMWHVFQPNDTYVSEYCLNNLKKFRAICEEEKMDFFLSVFTGWMSTMMFLPPWLNVGGFDCWKKGIFSNSEAIEAEKFYIEKIAEVVADSDAFLGFDLGNELNCLTRLELDPDLTREIADNWSHTMFDKFNEVAPGKLHNNGMAHAPWFGETFFSRETLANDGSLTPLHAWSQFMGITSKYGNNSIETYRLPNYMVEMARAYANDSKRLYQIQEFGMADHWAKNEEELEKFIYGTLENCASDPYIWGITWWCSHDTGKHIKGPFNYDLGVLTTNNEQKKSGLIFKKFIENYKAENYLKPLPEKAIVILPGTGDENDCTNAYRYLDYCKKGINLAFVTEEKKNDAEYLKSRGIREVIEG